MSAPEKKTRPSLASIDAFFRTKITPEIAELEKERRHVLLAVGVSGVLAIAFLAALKPLGIAIDSNWMVFFFAGFIALAGLLTYIPVREYKKSFKYRIMKKITAEFFPGMEYTPEYVFPLNLYEESGLFRTEVTYEGNDLFKGKVGEVDFQFSDLYTWYYTGTGKNRRKVTVFKGLMFCGDFHRDLRFRTLIMPDVAESSLGILGRGLQRAVSGGRLVDLENPEFEKLFKVTSDDQVEARTILTPKFMEMVLKFRQKMGCDIHMSFVNGRMHLAVANNTDLFEPSYFGPVVEHKDIMTFIDALLLMYSVAEEFCQQPAWRNAPVELAKPTDKFTEMRDYFKKNFG